MRAVGLASLLFAASACATAPAPFSVSAPGGEGAFQCAAAELRAAGFDVEMSDTSAEATRVERLAPAEANREQVALTLVEGTEGLVRADVRRWHYGPALHGLPVDRQQAQPVSVDEETSAQVDRIMRSCQEA